MCDSNFEFTIKQPFTNNEVRIKLIKSKSDVRELGGCQVAV